MLQTGTPLNDILRDLKREKRMLSHTEAAKSSSGTEVLSFLVSLTFVKSTIFDMSHTFGPESGGI